MRGRGGRGGGSGGYSNYSRFHQGDDFKIPFALDKPHIKTAVSNFIRTNLIGNYLNLSSLEGNSELMSAVNRISPGTFNLIFTLANEINPNIDTINLSNNKLKSTFTINAIKLLKNLRNLSLENNELLSFDMSDDFNELDLSNNPQLQQRLLPNVKILNKVKRLPIFGQFFDSENTKNTVDTFLAKFIDSFDNNRNRLPYTNGALFSLSINAFNVTELDVTLKQSFKSQKQLWQVSDRNLLRCKKKEFFIFYGATDIHRHLQLLPPSKHDYLYYDAYELNSALYVSLHGKINQYLFDRSLILVPSTDPNWNAMIASDMLVIRSKIEPIKVAKISSFYEILNKFSTETNLNLEFSLMCLRESFYDPVQAFELFQQAKVQNRIPVNAYKQ